MTYCFISYSYSYCMFYKCRAGHEGRVWVRYVHKGTVTRGPGNGEKNISSLYIVYFTLYNVTLILSSYIDTTCSTSLKLIYISDHQKHHNTLDRVKFSAFEFGMCTLMGNSHVHCAIHESREVDKVKTKRLFGQTLSMHGFQPTSSHTRE